MNPVSGYHHGNLREALVDAALGLLATKGMAGLSLRGVARQAGVSQAAPYHHFKDKEALLAAVAEQGFHRLREAMEAIPDDPDPVERFYSMGRAYVAFAVANPHHYKVMFGSEIEDKGCHVALAEAGDGAFGRLLEEIAGLQGAGIVAPGNPLPYALSVWSTVHGLASLLVDGIETRLPSKLERMGVAFDGEIMIDTTLRSIIDGIRVR